MNLSSTSADTLNQLQAVTAAVAEKHWLEAVEKAAALLVRCEGGTDPVIQGVAVKASLLSAQALAELGQNSEALIRLQALQSAELDTAVQAELAFRIAMLQYTVSESATPQEVEAQAQMLALFNQRHTAPSLEQRRWQARAGLQWARWKEAEIFQDQSDDERNNVESNLVSYFEGMISRFENEQDSDIAFCVVECMGIYVHILRDSEQSDAENQIEVLLALQWARYAKHEDSRVQASVLGAQFEDIAERAQPLEKLNRLEVLITQFADNPDLNIQRQIGLVRFQQAEQLRKLGRWQEALEILQTQPDNVNAWKARADIWYTQLPPILQGEGEAQDIAELAWTHEETQYAQLVEQFAAAFIEEKDEYTRRAVANELYSLGVSQRERRHLNAAVQTYKRLLAAFADDAYLSQEIVSTYLNLGYLLFKLLGQPEEALLVYNELFARFKHSLNPRLRDSLAKASASRTHCIGTLRDAGKEVSYGEQYETLTTEQVDAIRDKRRQALSLAEAGKRQEAIALFDEVLKQYDQSIHPDLRMRCCDMLLHKALQLSKLLNHKAALATYELLIARYGDELDTTVQKDVALAMANKAWQLDRLGRTDEELVAYDDIIKRYASNNLPYMQERVVKAQLSKAITLTESGEDKKIDIAKTLYRSISARWLTDGPAPCRLEATKASNNLALLLRKDSQFDEAVNLYESVLQTYSNTGDDELHKQCVNSRVGLARCYGKVGKLEQQKDFYRTLLALPQSDLTPALRTALTQEFFKIEPISAQLVSRFKNMFSKPKK